jgi:hypothetical protein
LLVSRRCEGQGCLLPFLRHLLDPFEIVFHRDGHVSQMATSIRHLGTLVACLACFFHCRPLQSCRLDVLGCRTKLSCCSYFCICKALGVCGEKICLFLPTWAHAVLLPATGFPGVLGRHNRTTHRRNFRKLVRDVDCAASCWENNEVIGCCVCSKMDWNRCSADMRV